MKTGRKKLPPGMSRNQILGVAELEKAEILKVVEASGLTLSRWIRQAILGLAAKAEKSSTLFDRGVTPESARAVKKAMSKWG